MSAEASVGSNAADSASSAIATPSCHNTDEHRNPSLLGSKYVKLNVGGTLHYTTVQTLSKEDSLLRRICNGDTEATIDSEGE
uniref:Potassium channel tetramerisation-type BTB domain-containing protein n=1 Tax=Oryzias melastigma TaxID=30732 RepID=A0A3B3C2M5_ORYME